VDAERLRRRRDFSYTLLPAGLRREGRGAAREDLAPTGGDDELETGKENGDDHRIEHMFALGADGSKVEFGRERPRAGNPCSGRIHPPRRRQNADG
jgi:hypothetical protein